MQVKCKLCEKTMSGQSERMAAHFGQQSGCHVSKCKKATPESVVLGKNFLATLHGRREATGGSKKRAHKTNVSDVNNSRNILPRLEGSKKGEVDNSRNTLPRLEDSKKGAWSGENACDKAYMRFLIATGQSFGLGDSVHLQDLLESARACSGWTPRGRSSRRTLGTTDVDDEFEKVDAESKELMANGLERGKTLQIDCWTGKDVSLNV